jgi:alpha-amylase
MPGSRVLVVLFATVLAAAAAAPAWAGGDHARHSLRAPVTDDSFYFVMADRFENGDTANDRGGIQSGDRLVHGFDPTARGFYHGGDLNGLLDRIDYIRGLGTTAIWLTPSFKNKAVQLPDGPSAGYHGYWITDFTQIDPHLGTNAELRALVDAAHARGMKVFFDIITNHTADVIGYEEGRRRGYVSKDAAPYRTAFGVPFDDRDYAGTGTFPPLDPEVSFPYTPTVGADEPTKVPAWLNDLTLYHNRGDTTFVGENSYYGDFFGLDDLFTEHPRVVEGMIEIYKTWIRDMGIDGFRIDTMKHVNDEFWIEFAPEVLDFARRQGKREFFMFGEVFDTTKEFTSHFTTHDRVQAVIDFPFQAAAQRFAANSAPTDDLGSFFAGDDWYTDADSNVYQLPTFLGNHDMGRIGMFVSQANPGAPDAELVARDRLAHELMYLSRGNPVIYYGDEQGFTGTGGDQLARQDMFASLTPDYLDDDLLGTDATHAQSNFNPAHPLYRAIGDLARLTQRHDALRDGAQIHRLSSDAAGIYAFSRLDRRHPHEYVVALNNSESSQTAPVPTYMERGRFDGVYGAEGSLRSDGAGRLTVEVPPLSAVVYRAFKHVPRSRRAPDISLRLPGPFRDRLQVAADVEGDSFYEVTFLARKGNRGRWRAIGTDDNAPYRVFEDVADVQPGTRIEYKAVVLDNAGHKRTSRARSATVAPPAITLEAPPAGGRVRGTVEVRAVATPEHPYYVVRIERSVNGGPFTTVATDDSSPVYTAFDNTSSLPDQSTVTYRAVLTYAPGRTVTSDTRTVTVVQTAVTTAIVHYNRPGGDYGAVPDGWGLHLWHDPARPSIDPAVLATVTWDRPFQRTGMDAFGAVYAIPLINDTNPVNFIMHLPNGDSVPTTREPGGDRSFVPLDHPEIWLKQGDPTIYFSPPPT